MNEAPVENGFFRWVRELDVRRGTDHWVGGVASGLAERFDLAPILVRGIFVALSCFAGLGLLVYGLAWALLPGPDGKIHAQEVVAGRWSSGMSGALVFFVLGALGFPAFFSWWDGGFWTLAVIGAIIFLVFSRRGRFAEPRQAADGAPTTGPWATQQPSTPPDAGSTRSPGSSLSPLGTDSGTQHSPAVPETPADDGFAAAGDTVPRTAPGETATGDQPVAPTPTSQPVSQESTMPFSSPASPENPTVESAVPPMDPTPEPGTGWSAGGGFAPPPYTAPPATNPPKAPRNRAMPGYAASIVLGLAVLVFALIVGLNELGMLDLPTSPVAIGIAAALVVIALGVIGAALNHRTGGALVGFGIAALVLSLVFSGGALRVAEVNMFSNGISTTDGSGSTNVFHSGEMDLRHYSTITEDTTVSIDNVFSSIKVIVPDNIPVLLDTDGAFSSLQVTGSNTNSTFEGGNTRLNPGATGPALRIDLDGAFNSVEINVQKAEVAP